MNAKAMVDIGAAVLLPQKGMSGDSLAHMAMELLGNPGRLSTMETAARGFAKKHAAADIASGLQEMIA